ncbi:MAG TPA: hypothetical protein VN038_28160 [Dyadobacter sp.]|nr:hypothetical protein [Dyadobacter sp.]
MKALKDDKTAMQNHATGARSQSDLPEIDDATLIRLAKSPFFEKKRQEAVEALSRIAKSQAS